MTTQATMFALCLLLVGAVIIAGHGLAGWATILSAGMP